MEFDLEQVDALLSTTRAVRRRLDLDRPVPDDVLFECVDLAEQAPTGANQASRRWLVVRDPELKAAIATHYRAGLSTLTTWLEQRAGAGTSGGTGGDGSEEKGARIATAVAHLADHLEQVPALVIVTIRGTYDGSGRPGLFDSAVQAAWSFCLALRSRGLGSTWTTAHLDRAGEVGRLLGIPDDVTQVVLLPVGWTTGGEFHRAPRPPARDVTYFDRWGFTRDEPSVDGLIHFEDTPGVVVEVDIDAPPAAVWTLVTDVDLPAAYSTEFKGGHWIGDGPPGVGSTFVGRNENAQFGAWETTSHVVAWQEPETFGWVVADDPADPFARWRFDLEPTNWGASTRLRFSMKFGTRLSPAPREAAADPERAEAIFTARMVSLRENMERTVRGVKARLESTG